MANQTIFGRLLTGFKAFRESFVISGLQDDTILTLGGFEDWNARRVRYEVFWAQYENTVFRDIHRWSNKLKADYSLYRHIRNIYNPAYRLGEFWKSHIFGGTLDPEAGDGLSVPSAIPLVVPKTNQVNEDGLRKAIAQTWRWSKWASKKDLFTLYGGVLGDVFLEIVDDTDLEQVYFDTIHPGLIVDSVQDRKGNLKSYTLMERRAHPLNASLQVTYEERCINEDGNVRYETYLNGEPYAWDAKLGETWPVDYGFIPMVQVKHIDVGLDWGWSEFHAGRPKFQELDDIASKFHDHIRKSVDPAWFMSGVSKSRVENTVQRTEQTPDQNDSAPDRESLPFIYATNPQARATALLSDLELEGVLKSVESMIEEIERDYPELHLDENIALATQSSRAIRVARQKTEAKVIQRRPEYDDALQRANMMAVSIGALRGYDAFTDFSEASFEAGALEHYMGKRQIFGKDPLDDIEIAQKFWEVADLAVPHIGLQYFLEREGWDEEDITIAVAANEKMKAEQQAQESRELTNRNERGNNPKDKEEQDASE